MKAAIECKIVARRSLSLILSRSRTTAKPKRESNLPLPRPTSLRCAQTTLTCATAFSPALLSPGAAAARVCADQAGKAIPQPNVSAPPPARPHHPPAGARAPVQRRSKRLCFLPRSAAEPRRTVRQGSFISLRGFSSSCTVGDLRSCVSAKRRRHTVCGVRPQYCVRGDAQSARLGHAHVSC